MAVKGLKTALSTKGGKADVLVVGDHGITTTGHVALGIQELGTDHLTPNNSGLLDQIAGFVRKKGKLVITGCNVFDANTVQAWQRYATAVDITIIGSASPVHYSSKNGCTGVWVTLTPGGTAPTIID